MFFEPSAGENCEVFEVDRIVVIQIGGQHKPLIENAGGESIVGVQLVIVDSLIK
jgi:hypothetical protein